jgi:hypothetical protein
MRTRTLIGDVAKDGGGIFRVERIDDGHGRHVVAVREMYVGKYGRLLGAAGLDLKPKYVDAVFRLALRAAKGGDA